MRIYVITYYFENDRMERDEEREFNSEDAAIAYLILAANLGLYARVERRDA